MAAIDTPEVIKLLGEFGQRAASHSTKAAS
jgi:hypothetical protein